MAEQKENSTQRGRRSEIVGVVTSDKMNKTRSVRISRLVKHVRYGKYIRQTSVFKAHDEGNVSKTGDVVRMFETRRLSKTKTWKIAEVVEKARQE